ncbi:MAG: hypothetical protein WD844_15760 [Thermoleophilaceae bacterium]
MSGSARQGAQREHVLKLSHHPRAARHIRAAKGWGGLVGFGAVGLLSWGAGIPEFEVGLRALAGGVAGYVVAWTGAVHVWRHLAVAELRAAQRRALERRRAAVEGRRPADTGAQAGEARAEAARA